MRVSEGLGFGGQSLGAMLAGSEENVPSKKFKKIKRDEIPDAFDLDLVNFTDFTYMPGGIDRAVIDAGRNRHHTFRGIAWSLGGGISVQPGDWILLPMGANNQEWFLIYSADAYQQVIVSQGGGYLAFAKGSFLNLTIDVRRTPPWEDDEMEAA